MQSHFNLEVVIVSIVAFIILLFTNLGYASGLDNHFLHTVYESEALHSSSPNFSKASHSRSYGKRYYGYHSNRNYNRGNRYYRGGLSRYRGYHHYNRGKRYYKPRYHYYGKRHHRRYGH